MIEKTLQKIARQIMALNEETLTALLPRYKERMMNFAPTQQWEESVVIYFLINGLRIKNSQFNDKIKEYTASGENGEKNSLIRPRLRLIKTEEGDEPCRPEKDYPERCPLKLDLCGPGGGAGDEKGGPADEAGEEKNGDSPGENDGQGEKDV